MRDLVLIVAFLATLPLCFLRPYIGIFLWYWVAFMNPHRLTFGFMRNFPLAQWLGSATLLGWILMGRTRRFAWGRESTLLALLVVLFTSNTVFALFPQLAWVKWQMVAKIVLMTFVTIWTIDTKEKLRGLFYVTAYSICFFAVKGVPWAIATGSQQRLMGPADTFIGENNSLGMALNMMLPVVFFLARHESNRWLRMLNYAVFFLTIAGVFITYSRGSFLALSSVVALLVLRDRHKLLMLASLVVGVWIVTAVVPEKWFSRMQTIETYEKDESAMSRIETWGWAYDLAKERPLTGGGFEAFRANPTDIDAHSNYFGMLAEQGFLATGIYLLLIASCLFTLQGIARRDRGSPSGGWYGDCARMMQVSLVAYLVNGLTINRQYFDLFYLIVAMTVILKSLARAAEQEASVGKASDEREPRPVAGARGGGSGGTATAGSPHRPATAFS